MASNVSIATKAEVSSILQLCISVYLITIVTFINYIVVPINSQCSVVILFLWENYIFVYILEQKVVSLCIHLILHRGTKLFSANFWFKNYSKNAKIHKILHPVDLWVMCKTPFFRQPCCPLHIFLWVFSWGLHKNSSFAFMQTVLVLFLSTISLNVCWNAFSIVLRWLFSHWETDPICVFEIWIKFKWALGRTIYAQVAFKWTWKNTWLLWN